jgi:hypothetical protein
MSNVAEALDFRSGLAGWLDTLANFFCKDIRALPDEALAKSPGGVAKAPATIAAEVVSMCDWCAGALRGEAAAMTEDETGLPHYTSKEQICDAVAASAANLGSAIRGATDEILASVVTPPWQMPAPMAVHAQVAVNHIWYHDGQLNYLQALQGDSAVHWRD